MMKWITLLLIVMTTQAYSQTNKSPSKAPIKQYSEGACVLLAQKTLQYKRKFGNRSVAYQNAKTESDVYCKNPIKKLPKKVLIQMEQEKKNQEVLDKIKQKQMQKTQQN